MPQNPYQAPRAPIADAERAVVVGDSVYRDIRNAWIAALISGTATLIFTVISTLSTPVFGYSAWEFVDVALIFGLAYGIYRRSRVCAVLLLVYFVFAKFFLLFEGASLSNIPVALVFIYFFFRGVVGTLRYQKAARA